ncbi:MAG: DUF2332 family protein [Candidatus Promineifilaceae bacterium]
MREPTHPLLARFRKQAAFSNSYSPLYAALFDTIAGWLAEGESHPIASWLVNAANGRRTLDVSLLLAAGLHRDILLAEPAASALAPYYPSVGGRQPASLGEDGSKRIDPAYQLALYQAILARQDTLGAFIRDQHVQTNETGRGIAWLLPAASSGWPRLHLVDLGASAGLNLLAERRRYDFVDGRSERPIVRLGSGDGKQFTIESVNDMMKLAPGEPPIVLSRTGCDQAPFRLRSPLDKATLTAFVWPDQPDRMQRLQEAIVALHQTESSRAPVRLSAATLPDDLPRFLSTLESGTKDPILCYNTYIRMYLPDKGAALRAHIENWASGQERAVIWVQWEPDSCQDIDHCQAPELGWLAWTIDAWQGSHAGHWHVAWIHPHGGKVRWLPDLERWQEWARMMPA